MQATTGTPMDLALSSTDKVSETAKVIHFEYSKNVNTLRKTLVLYCIPILFIILTNTQSLQILGVKPFEEGVTEKLSYWFIFVTLSSQIISFCLTTFRELNQIKFNLAALQNTKTTVGAFENLESTINSAIHGLKKLQNDNEYKEILAQMKDAAQKTLQKLESIDKANDWSNRSINCRDDCMEGYCRQEKNIRSLIYNLEKPLDDFALWHLNRLNVALEGYKKGLKSFSCLQKIEFIGLGFIFPFSLSLFTLVLVLLKLFCW